MSKKAKKAKSRKEARLMTTLGNTRNELNRVSNLQHQVSAENEQLKQRVDEAEDRAQAMIKRSSERVDELMVARGKIDLLKEIIAGLEKSCAENLGTIRALNRQIDQAAPKVMVAAPMPARYLSPQEAMEFHQTGRFVASHVDTESLNRAMSDARKHWTAL